MSFSRPILRDKPFFLQAATLMMIIFGGGLLFAVVSLLFQMSFLGYEGAMEFSKSIEHQIQHIQLTKLIQIFSQILVFMIPAIIFAFLMSGDALAYLNLNRFPKLSQIILATLITFSAGIFVQLLVQVNEMISLPDFLSGLEENLMDIQEKSERLMDAFLAVNTFPALLVLFLMIGILPAISEEFLFRGVMQRMLTENRFRVFFPILVTAVTFALIHFQFHNFLAITFMGLVLGYLYHWSQNLWLPVIAHMVNNSLQVLLVYLHRTNAIEANVNELDNLPYWISLASGFILINLFILFKRASITKS